MKWSTEKLLLMTEMSFNDFLEEGQTVETAVARVIYEMENIIEADYSAKVLVYNKLNQLSQLHGITIPYLIDLPRESKKRGAHSTKQLDKELVKAKMVV